MPSSSPPPRPSPSGASIAPTLAAFEGDSQVRFFGGNYSEYEDFPRREHGERATDPHRIEDEPLVRD